MSADPAAHLHLVDTDTGESIALDPKDCPGCQARQHALDELNRKFNGALAQIGQLKADKAAEAKRSAKWPVVERLFVIWQRAGRHPGAGFRLDRYELVERFLKDGSEGPTDVLEGPPTNDFERCAAAIIGRTFQCFTKPRANGTPKRFDEWERIFKNSGEYEESRDRRPRDWRVRLAKLDPGPLVTGPRKIKEDDDASR